MNNIVKHWITSLIGLVLMLLACYDIYQDKELGYNLAVLFTGLIMLRMRDEWLKDIFQVLKNRFS